MRSARIAAGPELLLSMPRVCTNVDIAATSLDSWLGIERMGYRIGTWCSAGISQFVNQVSVHGHS